MFSRGNMLQRIQTTTNLLEVIEGDPTLQHLIAEIGFDQTRLDEGRTLLTDAVEQSANVQEQRGENLKSREEIKKLGRNVRSQYMLAVRLAREALRHRPADLLKLDLVGARESHKRPERWIGQARTFYLNITGPIQQEIQRYGLTVERIVDDRDALKLYAESLSLTAEYQSEFIAAQDRRRTAFDALDSWLRNLEIILRHVTKGNHILRQKLGLITPRRRSPKSVASKANQAEAGPPPHQQPIIPKPSSDHPPLPVPPEAGTEEKKANQTDRSLYSILPETLEIETREPCMTDRSLQNTSSQIVGMEANETGDIRRSHGEPVTQDGARKVSSQTGPVPLRQESNLTNPLRKGSPSIRTCPPGKKPRNRHSFSRPRKRKTRNKRNPRKAGHDARSW